jgi:uncharacterized cysteine cluster protein YcgN (CxxCxxCC family)
MGEVTSRFWEEKPLDKMTRTEWESLCDSCGKCCLHKLEDEDTGELMATNVACRMLDRRTGRCSDYRNRRIHVPECVRLTPRLANEIEWLPSTCAYRLLANGEALPDWHPLITGDPDSVRAAGQSVSGWTISEDDAGDLEYHLIDREL